MISVLNVLLILVGPFLVVAAVTAVAFPAQVLEATAAVFRPRPRPVARPRPARWVVAA